MFYLDKLKLFLMQQNVISKYFNKNKLYTHVWVNKLFITWVNWPFNFRPEGQLVQSFTRVFLVETTDQSGNTAAGSCGETVII